MTAQERKRRTPWLGRAKTRKLAANSSAARVKRHSRRLQVRDIRTLTLIGNALTKEKLTNDIQNTVNHSTTSSSIYKPHAAGRGAGTKNARTPRCGAHATLTKPTIARRHSRAQPCGYRQYGETCHIKGRDRTPDKRTGTVPDALPTPGRPRRLHNSTQSRISATRQHASKLRDTRLTRQREQPRHQTRR